MFNFSLLSRILGTYHSHARFLLEQQAALASEVLYPFAKSFLGAVGFFGKAGQAEEFDVSAVYHFLVDSYFVVCQLPAAFFAFRDGVVEHIFKIKKGDALPSELLILYCYLSSSVPRKILQS